VVAVVRRAATVTGSELALAQAEADALRLAARAALEGFDALLVPTTTAHPTPAEVAADPAGVNARLGTWTNGMNLLDLAGVAVPAADADGGCFGVTVVTRAFDDQVGLDLAARLAPPARPLPRWPGPGVALVVFGAHMRGEPLNHQLVALGGAFAGEVATAPDYRMVALPTTPPKPGIVPAGIGRGGVLRGERWLLPPAGLGRFLAALPPPMALGRVALAGGESAVGFLCDPVVAAGAPDITALGSWRTHLARSSLS
jgi:allophanate hydrolase